MISTICYLALACMLALATYGLFGYALDLWKGRQLESPKTLAIFIWLTTVNLAFASLNALLTAFR